MTKEKIKEIIKSRTFSSIAIPIVILAIVSVFYFGFKQNFSPSAEDMPTVPGPENSSLAGQSKGVFVYASQRGDGFNAVSLPDRKKYFVGCQNMPCRPYRLAGPDKEGRIAYISHGENFFIEKYYLVIASLRGAKHEILFTREGDAIDKVGDFMTLSHTGGRLAFVRVDEYKDSEGVLRNRDVLEIWDINEKKIIDSIEGIDYISWSPDEKKFVYDEGYGIYLYDTASKTETPIISNDASNPDNPIFHYDGKKIVFYRYYKEKSYIVDLETKEEKEISLPGLFGYGGASAYLGFPAQNILAFRALPTQGDASSGWTTGNSPIVGPKPLTTVKLSNLDTGEFQTIVSGLDPRDPTSYGVMDDEPQNKN